MTFQNVVIGKPIIEPHELLAFDKEDFERVEKPLTLFTEERFLPRIMVDAGIVKSVSEVRRNQPKLVKTLNELDFLRVKWGKRELFILVGE